MFDKYRSWQKNRECKRERKKCRGRWPTHEEMHYEDAVTVPKSKDIYRVRW